MKKTMLIIALCLLPFIASAQSIKESGIDEFTGNPIICTSWTGLGTKAILPSKDAPGLEFMIRYENGNMHLHLRWYNNVNVIKKDSELQFMMEDNSIIALYAIDDFNADMDVYTSLEKSHTRNDMHVVYEGDLSALANNEKVEKIRIRTIYGAKILELKDSNAHKIPKAYNLILEETEKY